MQTTEQTLKAQIAAVLNSGKGQLIKVSPEAIEQMSAILDVLQTTIGWDGVTVTEEEMELAQVMANVFSPYSISGEVSDGVLLAESAEEHQKSLDKLRCLGKSEHPGAYICAFLLAELLREERQFYREPKTIVLEKRAVPDAQPVAHSDVHKAFLKVFAAADTVDVTFSADWNNGTGYFDKLCHVDLGLPVGTRFRSDTREGEGRKIVGVVTGIGNVVFFERFLGGDRGVIVSNVPRELSFLIPSGSCNVDTFSLAAMYRYNNIGHTVEGIVLAAREASYVPLDKRVAKILKDLE